MLTYSVCISEKNTTNAGINHYFQITIIFILPNQIQAYSGVVALVHMLCE